MGVCPPQEWGAERLNSTQQYFYCLRDPHVCGFEAIETRQSSHVVFVGLTIFWKHLTGKPGALTELLNVCCRKRGGCIVVWCCWDGVVVFHSFERGSP